jgi:hypothetical protein
MGYERSSIAVIPQSAWEPLLSGNGAALLRCKSCTGYADPTATHSDCTIRGIRKDGYAGACKKRIPRAITATPTREDMSMTKNNDVPGKWTPEEDALLREFAHEGNAAVALRLGRSFKATQLHASHLGVSLRKSAASGNEPVTAVTAIPETIQHRDAPTIGEVSTDASADSPATPTPTVPGIWMRNDADGQSAFAISEDAASADSPVTAKLIDAFILTEFIRASTERDAERTDALIEIDALLALARAEIAELRIELMMLALRDKLGDDAEHFASEYIFPAIEAAELAAEVAA